MRHFLRAYLYKLVAGTAIIFLIGLISADIWLWQGDDGSSRPAGAGPGTQDGNGVPGLPARNTTGAPVSSGARSPRPLDTPHNSFYSTLFAVTGPKCRTLTRPQSTGVRRLCARSFGAIRTAFLAEILGGLDLRRCLAPHFLGRRAAPVGRWFGRNVGTSCGCAQGSSSGFQMVSSGLRTPRRCRFKTWV